VKALQTFWCIALCAALALPALGDQGTVVVAKGGARPLLLWDATPVVTATVANKQPRDQALRDLESQAMRILSEHANALKHAKTLTIRVIYQKTGAVSPVYGTATFEGIERVFELTAPAADARLRAKQLADAIGRGTVPAGIRLDVTGKLPPL
jgi:hypothetical protein